MLVVSQSQDVAVSDRKWLTLRGGNTWHAIMAVPRKLQAAVGKKHLLKSLRTTDLVIARAKRHEVIGEFQVILDKARRGFSTAGIMDAATTWRRSLVKLETGDLSGFSLSGASPGGDRQSLAIGVALDAIEQSADEIESDHGPALASAFLAVATGRATPLLHHVDAWLAEGGSKGPLKPRTAAMYRSDVKALAAWLATVGVTTVEGVTKGVAGRYVTEQLVSQGVHWETANRKITACASYWRWLRKRAGVDEHPWMGQHVAKIPVNRMNGQGKRPFTPEEIRALLSGKASTELADAMRVAALTGMRIDEIYRLTVADSAGGWFMVRAGKTSASVRRLPIHSGLREIVRRRCKGKAGEAFLFHEAGTLRAGRERSALASKMFGRYRQTVGVHDQPEGMRQSRVDFHSWRRWFVTTARNAGIDRAVVAAVVGHDTGNITDDVYHGGPADALLRACVEAVKLPSEF